MPKPWTSCVLAYQIEKKLKALFSESRDIVMRGPEAKKLYNELQQQENERRRDQKERLKKQMNSMDDKEKAKTSLNLQRELEDKYILSCRRFPIHPADFTAQEDEEYGETHFLACVKIFEKLEKHYQTSLKLQSRKRKEEEPIDTLQQFCDQHTVSVSPIECATLLNKAHHARAMRSVFRLLLGERGESKVHVCWLYDKPSSGKSQFIRRFRKIFSGDEVDWRGQYLPVR